MLNPDFRDMLSALSAEGVEFLLVGAYALAAHGAPRATGDLDIWVRPAPDNARKIMRALTAFGAPMTDIAEEDFARPDTVVQLGVAPRRIDILTGIDGVTFDDAWPNRVRLAMEGIDIEVIGREDFIRNKTASGRPQDLADVARLEREKE
jgi:hypothetical protein